MAAKLKVYNRRVTVPPKKKGGGSKKGIKTLYRKPVKKPHRVKKGG